MSCFVSVHLWSSGAFVKILKGNKNVLDQSSWGEGVYLNKPINLRKGLLIGWGIRQHCTWQARFVHMEPSLGDMFASPSHLFGLIFMFFLSPVSWTPGCLIQQQRGRSSRAGWCGLSVEHEVQEGYTGVRLPLSGTRSPSAGFTHTSLRTHRWLSPRQVLCQPTPVCSPLTRLLPLCPCTPYPPAFMHIVSSPYWHPAAPHLSTNTCSRGAGEDVWCRTKVRALRWD